ncbi:MAG TPA: CBASS cGAMP-activated phospholipase [Terriglobales bacterium]|nr:CBASS cGAMP-activated phospholipase [Terriglobales bacterium]
MAEPNPCINVLAIDGGGIRGIIPATILAELEKRLGKPIHEMFDLIAGTSTGGIIAVAIGSGANTGEPYHPADLVRLYVENGPEIFRKSWITDARKWVRPKYSPDALERILLKFFGDTELASARVPLLIGSYDIEGQIPFFFKSQRIPKDPNYNWKLREVARATSAAPTFFPPVKLSNEYHESYTLVDGGVCINNPAVAAFAEAHHIYGDGDYLIVSIGTGDRQDNLKFSAVKNWGMMQWARQITSVFMDSVSETADQELYFLLGRERQFRFQAKLKNSSNEMDCVTPENMQHLKEDAQACLSDNAKRFDQLCELLKSRPRPATKGSFASA